MGSNLSRRQMIGGVSAMALIAGSSSIQRAAAATGGSIKILINSAYLQTILNQAPDLSSLFDNTGSFMLCTPTSPPPSVPVSITPVGNYKSFAAAQGDSINPAYNWLLYDPEDWTYTPTNEQDDPRQYMQRFGQWAHSKGYRTIMAPARDLGNTDTVKPKNSGETLDSWYLRTNLASDGARYGDVFSIQSQYDTTNLTNYLNLVQGANNDAKSISGNPYCSRLCGLSTAYGTASQMLSAWNEVKALVGGFWMNIPDNNYSLAISFLRSL